MSPSTVLHGRRFFGAVFLMVGVMFTGALRAQTPRCVSASTNLVGWWRGENSAADSIAGTTGVLQSGVGFAAGEVGTCFSFTGETNSYIEVPDSPALRLTDELTIEFWVKRQRLTYPSSPYADYVLEKGGDYTGNQANYAAALHNASYNYCLHFVFAGGWRGGGSVADTNQWHHCAIVARQGDADPTLYIDGVVQAITYREGAPNINLVSTTRPLHIGALVDPLTGWQYYGDVLLDEMSIYDRALGPAEIQAIYAAGSAGKCPVPGCAAVTQGARGWWPAEGNGNDIVGTNHAVLSGGVTFTNGVVGQGFLFNGVDGRAVVNDSPAFNFGSNQDFAIDAWISPLPSSTDFGIMSIVDKRYAPTLTDCVGYSFHLIDGRIDCRISDSIPGGGYDYGPAGPDLRDGTFHHVALSVTRNSTTGGSLYVDGVEVLNFNPTLVSGDLSNTEPLRIGNHASSFINAFFKGRIDDVTLYARALSSYEVQAIYAAGSAGKCSAGSAPVLLSQPVDQTVNAGSNAVFSVAAQGATPMYFQWYLRREPVAGGNSALLLLSNVQPAQAGDYYVTVTNAFGAATSTVARLTVLTLPPAISAQPVDQTVVAGTTAVFTVGAEGTPPFSYQWFFGSTPLEGATSQALALAAVQPEQAGPYHVVVSNAWGNAVSSNAVLQVLTTPPAFFLQPRGTNTYVGTRVVLLASAVGSLPISYQWQKDGLAIAGATRTSLVLENLQVTNSGEYSAIATNLYGSTTSAVAVVNVRVPPPCVPALPGLVSWWPGQSNVLDNWDSNNGVLSSQTQVRYAPGRVGAGFLSSYFLVPDSPSLRVSNITLHAWVNAPTLSGTLPRAIVAKYDYPYGALLPAWQSSFFLGTTNNGRVYFAISSNGTNAVAVATTVPLPLNEWNFVAATYDGTALRIYTNGMLAASKAFTGAIFAGRDHLGIGGLANPSNPYLGYQLFGGSIDEVCLYSRALSDGEIMAVYNADVSGMCQQGPTIAVQPQSQTVPAGEDAEFGVTVLGSRPVHYQWFFKNEAIFRATNATLVLERIRTNQAGAYSVRVTNAFGFALSESAQLSVGPASVCVPAPAGLLSWWPADRTPIDVVGTNNPLQSALLFATGKVNFAFAITNRSIFYPLSVGITVPNAPSLNFRSNADFTIEGWVKALPGTNGVIFPRGGIPPDGTTEIVSKHAFKVYPTFLVDVGYSMFLDYGRLGCWVSSVAGRATNSATFVSGSQDLRDSMFHHLAWTFARNATNGGNLYVDGLKVLTFNTVPFAGDITNTGSLLVGGDGVFNGLIDELTFYSRALTADEVLAIRQAGAAGKCKQSPFIITQPASLIVPPGSNATFTVTAGGVPTLRYQWRFNEVPIAGATSSSLTITNVLQAKAGRYSVGVTNGFGGTLSQVAILALNQPPVARCAPRVVAAGPLCMADGSIDDGSFDPDGDPITLTQQPPGPYPLGTNVVTLTVADVWGFTNSCSSLVIVLDQTPPSITCPASITVTNAHGAWTSVVTFAPTVSDNCSSVLRALCTPPSGSAFSLGTTTVTCDAVDGSGNSNRCSFTVTVLPGNRPPVARIQIAPRATIPWLTNLFVIAGNGSNAIVVFDGSKSFDPDGDALKYSWYSAGRLFSTNRVTRQVLKVGDYAVTLRVDDTFPMGTNSTSVLLRVITAVDAINLIRQKVETMAVTAAVQHELLNSLDKASRELQRGHLPPARDALRKFQKDADRRVDDASLAQLLVTAAQQVLDALSRVEDRGHKQGPKPRIHREADGNVHLDFADQQGAVLIIEASSDLAHWEALGTASEWDAGQFEFDDAQAPHVPLRYYRVVTP